MFNSILSDIKSQKPLILNLTNYVTVNDVASCILAIGASPVMSDDARDSVELVKLASAVNINIGTVNQKSFSAMLKTAAAASKLKKILILDPAGAGATEYRTKICKKLISKFRFDVIKGNMSEIKAIANVCSKNKTFGVDVNSLDEVTENNLEENINFVKQFALKTNSIIAATGKYDLVTDGERCFVISNGNELMEKVCGTGCMISGMLGAFIECSHEKKLEAAAACICAMGIAGERDVKKIIENLFCMTDEILEQEAKYEIK